MTQPSVRAVSTGQATTASLNVTKPTGTTTDDVLLAFQSNDVGVLADMGTPTGGATWQLLSSRDETGLKSKAWWKVAGASEPANYGFTFNASTFDANVTIIAVQDGSASTPTVASVATGTGTSINTPGVTPPDALSLEIRYVAGDVAETTTTLAAPATYTEVGDLGGIYTISDAAHKQLADGTATSTLAFTTDNAPSVRHGFTVAIAQGAVPATINLATVATTTAVPAPSVGTGAGATPTTVAAAAAVPTPSIVAVTAGQIDLPAVPTLAGVPAPAVVANASITLPVITVLADMTMPTVTVPILPGDALDGLAGQLEFNGFPLGRGSVYRWINLVGWRDRPGIDSGNVPRASRHGSWAGRPLAQERTITWTSLLKAPAASIEAAINALEQALPVEEDETERPLVINDLGTPYLIYGRIDRLGLPVDKTLRVGLGNLALQWICSDPRRYGINSTGVTIAAGNSAEIVNAGNAATHPVLRVNGPVVNPSIVNDTLGRAVAFTITLLSGEQLLIDCDRGTASVGTVSKMGLLSGASVHPSDFVLGRGANVLSFDATSGGAGGVDVLYRDAWL